MPAKYRIFEAPDGRFKLGLNVRDGSRDFWMPMWQELWFDSLQQAQAALQRVITARDWQFDEEGKPYVESSE